MEKEIFLEELKRAIASDETSEESKKLLAEAKVRLEKSKSLEDYTGVIIDVIQVLTFVSEFLASTG